MYHPSSNLPLSSPGEPDKPSKNSKTSSTSSATSDSGSQAAPAEPLAPYSFNNHPQPRKVKKSGGRKIVAMMVLLVCFSILGGMGYYGYHIFSERGFFDSANGDSVNGNDEEDSRELSADFLSSVDLGPWTTPPPCLDFTDPGIWMRDTDEDGLTNAEERFFGTDPCNPDTSGDGMLDGEAVRSGLNPLGPGRLDYQRYGLPDPDRQNQVNEF